MLGPALGSFLFTAGGFVLPFEIIGSILKVSYVFKFENELFPIDKVRFYIFNGEIDDNTSKIYSNSQVLAVRKGKMFTITLVNFNRFAVLGLVL